MEEDELTYTHHTVQEGESGLPDTSTMIVVGMKCLFLRFRFFRVQRTGSSESTVSNRFRRMVGCGLTEKYQRYH